MYNTTNTADIVAPLAARNEAMLKHLHPSNNATQPKKQSTKAREMRQSRYFLAVIAQSPIPSSRQIRSRRWASALALSVTSQ